MKKFLSLVLALVMTMSLVTVGAGATEYKDLTDKSEIQYEEAVAVLNKLGIITGYEDGSFKPTGALTRGAAAKIIVSLMIGSEAAANLTVTAAPYSDVPVTNTFAGVISYCKTAGYINGYADGTFRPTAPLTGYAFSKMLLGALGYRGDVEGFTGSGWTMNVAKLGQKAGLFNDFATAFKGNDGVTREQACLLALNTLKATEVEYTANGNNLVVAEGGTITGATTNYVRNYVHSNNTKINKNISNSQDNMSNEMTLEFGEEHFPDLRLDYGKLKNNYTTDDFGRPANQWSYKNVKIGTYAWIPDYTYTTGASGDTDADKVKDMGIKDFTAPASYVENGLKVALSGTNQKNLEKLAKQTDNGVLVELYMNPGSSDEILAAVVVRTQLMQVKAVKSSEVTLKTLGDDQRTPDFADGTVRFGSTKGFVSVSKVEDDDSTFKTLSSLKADDYVLVVPVTTDDGSSYTVDSVSVPQSVTGKLTNIQTKSSDKKVKSITVAGTAYKMSNMWTAEDDDLNQATTLSNKVDTVAYLDNYGYAIYVKNVTSSNSAIIIDEIYQSLVDGKLVKYAKGWDANGNDLTLNLGTSISYGPLGVADDNGLKGKTFEYKTYTSNNAEYQLVNANTSGLVYAPYRLTAPATPVAQWIKDGQYKADLNGDGTATMPMASDVKFIFLSVDLNGSAIDDVTGVTVRNGVTAVGKDADSDGSYNTGDKLYNISYILNSDKNKVIAVVVDRDDDAAVTANLLYVDTVNNHWWDENNQTKSTFKAYDMEGNVLGEGAEQGACKLNKNITDLSLNGTFQTYSKNDKGVYTLTPYTQTTKTTSVGFATVTKSAVSIKGYIDIGGTTYLASSAKVVDLDTDDGIPVDSCNDLRDALRDDKATSFKIAYVYNGNVDTTGYRTISNIFVVETTTAAAPVVPTGTYSSVVNGTLTGAAALKLDTARVTAAGELKMNAVGSANLNTQIKEAMAALGYTDVTISKTGTAYTITGTKDGVKETVTCDTTADITFYYVITIDGVKQYVANSTAMTSADIGGASLVGTGFIVKDSSAAADYKAYADGYTVNGADATITTGYVKVADPTTTSGITFDAPKYAKVNSTFEVVVKVADTNTTPGNLSLTATGGTVTALSDVAITASNAKNVTFQVAVTTNDVTVVSATIA